MEALPIFIFLCILSMGSLTSCSKSNTLDVTEFGAQGNGKTDDSKAFLAAWNAACQSNNGETKIVIPEGNTYLLNPIIFEGPCKSPSIIIQVSGDIVAPDNKSAFKSNIHDTWIFFKNIDGLAIHGNGQARINGRGSIWWSKESDKKPPVALKFDKCKNLVVDGLNHVDSPRNHISINNCNGATISNLKIIAPGKSPNTDGIDLSGSTNVHIHDVNIATGDDCIAIKGGCSSINITEVSCGPGHGISIGSLGEDGKRDEVEDVKISNCTFTKTENGVRIKTYQGGSGFAKRISFTGITINDAYNPIVIDQYYCPHKKCGEGKSTVEVSDVLFSDIRGTSMKSVAVSFNCSQTTSCTNIIMDNVDLRYQTYAKQSQDTTSSHSRCINAYGIVRSSSPGLDCLQAGPELAFKTPKGKKKTHKKKKNKRALF